MCGIAGLFNLQGDGERDPAATALAMVNTLAHRGPDGQDSWGDKEAGIGLGHRRLAIVDLSTGGAQPMHSADGRYVITYNGEVYNFQDLRYELSGRGHTFQSTSDTEVMLAAFSEWGPEEAIQRFVGMFAFALFDRKKRILRLVRDRLGVKPLYWTIANGTLLFGSELRALKAHPSFRKDVDREAIAALLRYSYIPTPTTIFRNVFKLPAGTMLSAQQRSDPSINPYWQLSTIIRTRGHRKLSLDEATTALDEILRDAVRQRMIADVPIGAFLSGGTDSAAVVAMMQSVSDKPARTFTIGFCNSAYDESAEARAIAEHLGSNHTEISLGIDTVQDLVGDVAHWFDEPFADSSQLPTYLVSRATREHVTVALSGDGGDEVFGGYPKYFWLDRVWNATGCLPLPLRSAIGSLLRSTPASLLRSMAACWLETGRAERIDEKVRRLASALAAREANDAARVLDVVGSNDISLVKGAHGTTCPLILEGLDRLPDLISRMQAQDTATYLPDDILTKVDRCSMAVSLEAREPLLDHRLIEFVWSLPVEIHRGGHRSKGLLREVLARYVPRTMTDRPKRGFSVPIAQWLRGPLRGWANDLLSPAAVTKEGFLDAAAVASLWHLHCDGKEDHATTLWNILMLRAWSTRWLEG